MPVPVSVTHSTTYCPAATSPKRRHIGVVEIGVGRLDGEAAAVRHGVLGVHARLSSTFSSWLASAKVGHSPPPSTVSISIRLAERAAQACRACRRQAGSRRCGAGSSAWRREKASSRWVSCAALRAPCIAASSGCQSWPQRASVAAGRRASAKLPPHGVEIADDDGEQIVEVVGDAAGELAHRLHLLRLRTASTPPRGEASTPPRAPWSAATVRVMRLQRRIASRTESSAAEIRARPIRKASR